MAVLLSALMIHGVQPGPLMISQNPNLFWAIVASMYIGNIMLLVLNLPLIGLWVQVLKIPYKMLFPIILLFCIIGVYSVSSTVFDIYLMIGFGVLGYLMQKFEFEAAPLVLGFVLGPLLEHNLRKTLIMSDGNFEIFLRPISFGALAIAAVLLLTSFLPTLRKKRAAIPTE
jgi:putative tricarboxylic transport membrane protein